jgi:chemotaxis protein MotA
MKAVTAIGIGVALLGLGLGMSLEGGGFGALFNMPALLIVLGGTAGATLAGTSLERFKAIPQLYRKAFDSAELHMAARVELLVSYAERARREGLLALDEELPKLDDDFTRKGMQLVVDGTDPELVRDVLESDIDGMSVRHKAAVQPFEKAGGFAPTMGILGTVMGLVHVLQNLAAPETLGPAISTAFIATLYGVASANVVFLPVANKLKALSEIEVELKSLTVEGILAVQAGDNPRVVADKLQTFVPPDQRQAAEEAGRAAAQAAAPQEAPAEAMAA